MKVSFAPNGEDYKILNEARAALAKYKEEKYDEYIRSGIPECEENNDA